MTFSALRRSSCQLVKSSRLWLPYVIQAHEGILKSPSHPSQDTDPSLNPDSSPQLINHAPGFFKVSGAEVNLGRGSNSLLTYFSGSLTADLVGFSVLDKTSQSLFANSSSGGDFLGDDRLRPLGSERKSMAPLQILNELVNKLHLPSNHLENSPLEASSVKKKRRLKMNKHKHRKLRRRERHRNK